MKGIITTTILTMSLFLGSCSKDEETPKNSSLPTLNDMEKKMLGSWKLVKAMTYSEDMKDSTDELQDCLKDDVFTFKNTKKYSADLGSDDCNYYYSISYNNDIEWHVTESSELLFQHWYNYRASLGEPLIEIVELTNNRLVLQQGYRAIGNRTAIHTYMKQ